MSKSIKNKKIDNKEIKIKDLEKQLIDEKESRLRVLADFQNYKKRIESEKNELSWMASRELIIQLTEIIDDYYRSQQHENKNSNDSKKLDGYEMIFKKIQQILINQGLE